MIASGLKQLGFELDRDFVLVDHGDGPQIVWLAKDKTQPNTAEIAAAGAVAPQPPPSLQEQIDALTAVLVEEDPERAAKIEEKRAAGSLGGIKS